MCTLGSKRSTKFLERSRNIVSDPISDPTSAAASDCRLYYWRNGTDKVDFVLQRGQRLVAIEVKSGAVPAQLRGLAAFEREFGDCRHLLIGDGGIPLAEFLSYPAEHWL
jgi:hypothetical protein